jgi:type IV pilus assembly protein PilP
VKPLAIGIGIVLLGLGCAVAQGPDADPATLAAVEVQSGRDAVAGAAKQAVAQVFGDRKAAVAGAPATDGDPGEPVAAVPDKGRDPFRPFTLDLRSETYDNEPATPLQRYELPELRLAGIVLDLKTPRAMLQDNSGMGYIVVAGTPIGRRRGVVKAIEARRVVVEEHVLDYYGHEQVTQVVIEMPNDEKPQSANRE